MERIIYSCVTHIEELLDNFLDEFEMMPVMEEVIDIQVTCHECQTRAQYKLLGSEVKAEWE